MVPGNSAVSFGTMGGVVEQCGDLTTVVDDGLCLGFGAQAPGRGMHKFTVLNSETEGCK